MQFLYKTHIIRAHGPVTPSPRSMPVLLYHFDLILKFRGFLPFSEVCRYHRATFTPVRVMRPVLSSTVAIFSFLLVQESGWIPLPSSKRLYPSIV